MSDDISRLCLLKLLVTQCENLLRVWCDRSMRDIDSCQCHPQHFKDSSGCFSSNDHRTSRLTHIGHLAFLKVGFEAPGEKGLQTLNIDTLL